MAKPLQDHFCLYELTSNENQELQEGLLVLSGLPVAHAKELGNSWNELQVESSQRQQLVVEVDRQPVRVSQMETALHGWRWRIQGLRDP